MNEEEWWATVTNYVKNEGRICIIDEKNSVNYIVTYNSGCQCLYYKAETLYGSDYIAHIQSNLDVLMDHILNEMTC